jgi:hypothetical protein
MVGPFVLLGGVFRLALCYRESDLLSNLEEKFLICGYCRHNSV